MRQGSTKIGRNDSCPCGNGKKFKRCHGAAAAYPVTYPATQEMVERGRLQLAQHQASEKQREQQQGFGKPIISLEMKGTRFVAVGKTLRYSTKWKTVHDFLGDYIRAVLGTDWGNTELAKPFEQRHPILIWYHHLCLLQQTFITELGNVHSAPMTGAAAAWFQLAYDLYSLEHNAELQQKLLDRIKNPDMFSGARYETFVAGVMIHAYDRALAIEPNNASVLDYKCDILRRLERYDEAIQVYDRLLAIDPNNVTVLGFKGYALFILKRYEEAIQAFDRALAIAPNEADAWHFKGAVLYALNRHEAANQSFARALAIDSIYATVWLSDGYDLLQLERYEEAIQVYDRLLAIDPNNIEAWYTKGNALHWLKRYDEAIQVYNRALEIDPNNELALKGKKLTFEALKTQK